ncbi:hypothetical protein [Nostoc sp. TCL26-01]|nr:hypothetical protein [Nostoc sp. TCL26-01]
MAKFAGILSDFEARELQQAMTYGWSTTITTEFDLVNLIITISKIL